tara:strand:+ start:557 stop:1024 length:468 start_codon:yes stop_codon:yes gene_type:complete
MKKTYQIYANSNEGVGDIENKEYTFDWNIMPEGTYEMTWSFRGEPHNISTSFSQLQSVVTKIAIDVPFMTDRYEVSLDAGNASSTNVAGFIQFYEGQGHSGFILRQYRAEVGDNAPVILRGKPSGNTFKVRCLQTSNELGTMFPYVLVITIKHIC